MRNDRIDFISSYCDCWCERCAFTSRCSVFACQIATEMCGDFAEGLELAIGTPHPVDGEPPESPAAAWIDECVNVEMPAQERAEFDHAQEARSARVDGEPLAT